LTLPLYSLRSMGRNALHGTLPSEFSSLKRLNYLYSLSRTRHQTKIIELILNRYSDTNRFSGSLPASWSGMTSLSDVFFDLNLLEGSLPSEWSQLTFITRMWVSSFLELFISLKLTILSFLDLSPGTKFLAPCQPSGVP